MLKKSPKFVMEFLIPSLDSGRFGSHLQWLDKDNSIFQLGWRHKGENHWSEGEAQVFVEWDKLKGRYQPEEKEYFTKSKQRFRALLYKLSQAGQIMKIKSDIKSRKVYCITGVKKPRKKRVLKPIIYDDDVLSSLNRRSFAPEDVADIIEICEVSNMDEMTELCSVNSSTKDLDDQNYIGCLTDNSAEQHRTAQDDPKSVPSSSYEESYSSLSSPEYCPESCGDFDELDLELSYEYFRALNERYEQRMQGEELHLALLRWKKWRRNLRDSISNQYHHQAQCCTEDEEDSKDSQPL